MSEPADVPFVSSVLHPSDFSLASRSAFAHALAIALLRQTGLTLLHANRGEPDWKRFPAVRGTLERWGLLAPGSPRSALMQELQLRVEKVAIESDRPLPAILEYLEQSPADLLVLATAGRNGLPRWLHRSVAEPVARHSRTLTLFVPEGAAGFVDADTGRLSLQRVVIAVDHEPDPTRSLVYAMRAARALGDERVEMELLHVGEEPPRLTPPEDPQCVWTESRRLGDPVEAIAGAARTADLVVMTTAGHQGVLDVLRGSTTERVLRRVSCPLMAVPA